MSFMIKPLLPMLSVENFQIKTVQMLENPDVDYKTTNEDDWCVDGGDVCREFIVFPKLEPCDSETLSGGEEDDSIENSEILELGSIEELNADAENKTRNKPKNFEHSNTSTKCVVCKKVFTKLSRMETHLNRCHTALTIPCRICNKVFHTKETHKRHLSKFHNRKRTRTRAPEVVTKRSKFDSPIDQNNNFNGLNLNLNEECISNANGLSVVEYVSKLCKSLNVLGIFVNHGRDQGFFDVVGGEEYEVLRQLNFEEL